jgi:hypothetical protein
MKASEDADELISGINCAPASAECRAECEI